MSSPQRGRRRRASRRSRSFTESSAFPGSGWPPRGGRHQPTVCRNRRREIVGAPQGEENEYACAADVASTSASTARAGSSEREDGRATPANHACSANLTETSKGTQRVLAGVAPAILALTTRLARWRPRSRRRPQRRRIRSLLPGRADDLTPAISADRRAGCLPPRRRPPEPGKAELSVKLRTSPRCRTTGVLAGRGHTPQPRTASFRVFRSRRST